MGLSKKYNVELFDNISYIIKFISETSNVAMEDGQYIFIRNIGPGFISTSPDNNNKLMRNKLNEITEYVDLNLVSFQFPFEDICCIVWKI